MAITWKKLAFAAQLQAAFGITIDGGGAVITTGVKGYLVSPYACTITGWHLVADPSGSIVIDVWKSAGAIPTVANRIAGTEIPTLVTQTLNSDTNLTTWSTLAIAAGDVIVFNVDSVSVCQIVTLSIGILH